MDGVDHAVAVEPVAVALAARLVPGRPDPVEGTAELRGELAGHLELDRLAVLGLERLEAQPPAGGGLGRKGGRSLLRHRGTLRQMPIGSLEVV